MRARDHGVIHLQFRFYGPLNDFLPASCRQARFPHVIFAPASVKDVIEALGVPHPEVGLLLVNGTSEDFGYRVCDGDDVAVYPAFQSIDLAGLQRVGDAVPQPVRFVLDIHLGKLASLLRLCGFDALLLAHDADVANVSAHDGRVALTRDVGLLKRSVIRYGYWVRDTRPEGQLAEVLAQFDVGERIEPFTRCLRCNTPLVVVDADAVADRVPPRTRGCFDRFRECRGCGRVYWPGSHYARLGAVVDRARERVYRR